MVKGADFYEKIICPYNIVKWKSEHVIDFILSSGHTFEKSNSQWNISKNIYNKLNFRYGRSKPSDLLFK